MYIFEPEKISLLCQIKLKAVSKSVTLVVVSSFNAKANNATMHRQCNHDSLVMPRIIGNTVSHSPKKHDRMNSVGVGWSPLRVWYRRGQACPVVLKSVRLPTICKRETLIDEDNFCCVRAFW